MRLAAPNWQLGAVKPAQAAQSALSAADDAIAHTAKKPKTEPDQSSHKIQIIAPSMAKQQ
jgi:hypothetical protein